MTIAFAGVDKHLRCAPLGMRMICVYLEAFDLFKLKMAAGSDDLSGNPVSSSRLARTSAHVKGSCFLGIGTFVSKVDQLFRYWRGVVPSWVRKV